MKSFICEAQTLEMAVRKAWENVGKPNVFFIKLVEKGNESIFWWKRKNFKIAFFYELKANVFEINDSFEKDFKKNDKKIFGEKNTQNQKINTEKKPFVEYQNNEAFKKKDFINIKNSSFEGNSEKRDSFQKDSYQKNIENKVFDKKIFENKNFDQRNKSQNFKSENPKNEYLQNDNQKNEHLKSENFNTEKSFETKEEKRNEGFQRKNENLENKNQRVDSSNSTKRLIWSERQIKFLKSFSINFYANFFERKEKVDFFIDNENVCKINFGKGPFEDSMKNKDLSLSISTVFSEVLYSKFRDFDIRNCKIIINFE